MSKTICRSRTLQLGRPRRRVFRQCRTIPLWLVGLIVSMLPPPPLLVAEDDRRPPNDAAGLALFESKIRPLLVNHCYECHSASSGSEEGGLRVDSRSAIRAGGDRGPAVVPGDPQASLLLVAMDHLDPDLEMPPKKTKLSASAIADVKKWIQWGAPDPRDDDHTTPRTQDAAEVARNHWAYQPLRTVSSADAIASQRGAAMASSWPVGAVDRMMLAELANQGLKPSADAAPSILLRRIHFDLVGLPPTPKDLNRFLRRIDTDGLDTAIATEVDALLASPRFGERWGKHWLDVARFGESSGKEANISFPYAWRYRDYVIDAFNQDLPYDRFLTEQIAGDLLPAEDDVERARLLIATGFLALGPKNLDEANGWQFLSDLIDEQIDSVTRAVIASSVACARCHDHKFDPFSMRDYYALVGIFASTETFFGTAVSPANRVGGTPLRLPDGTGHAIFHPSLPSEKVAELQAELTSLERKQSDGMAAIKSAVAEGKDPSDLFTLREALGIFWRSGAIRGQLAKVSERGQALPLAMGVLDRPMIIDAPLLQRGDIAHPGDTIARAFPSAIPPRSPVSLPKDQSGRLELARWITHPEHPLTSRVMVNRVWQHLFGAGLVRTVDDFGTTGQPPSHPELLDHLATEFVEGGWRVKPLIRQLVLSKTYRQSSDHNQQAFLRDPENRFLGRASKRRLEAEAIRDAMLSVSGELDQQRPRGSLVAAVIGDRPISLIGMDKRLPTDLDGSVHRSIYLPVIRDRLPDVLDLFDAAEPSLVTGQRETTNVPIQALYMMNSPFVQDRSKAFATRLRRGADSDPRRVELAFKLCFNRPPYPEERKRSMAFLSATEDSVRSFDEAEISHKGPDVWDRFCQALLSTAEFRNLD